MGGRERHQEIGEDAVEMAMGRAQNARKFQRLRGRQLSLNSIKSDYPSYFKGSLLFFNSETELLYQINN